MPNAFDQSWFSASYAQRIWFEDVNGDNKDDFIGVSVSGDIYVSLNNVNLINGNYTFSAPTNKGSSPFLTSSGWFSSNYTSRVWPADVNGDDKLDLVGIDTNGDIIIEMNTGLFIQIEVEVSNGYNSSYFTNTSRQRVWACDIDGDDKADFVGVDSQGYIYSLRQRRIIIS